MGKVKYNFQLDDILKEKSKVKKILQVNFKYKVTKSELEKAFLQAAPTFGPARAASE